MAQLQRYPKLPAYSELSKDQRRLLAASGGAGHGHDWSALDDDHKATFFQVTYVLERTPVGSRRLVDFVQYVEAILGGHQVRHTHGNGRTDTVTGWRLHVKLSGISLKELLAHCFGVCDHYGTNCKCSKDKDMFVSATHKTYGFTESIRDYREEAAYEGPFLQIALSPDGSEADVDIDKGRPPLEHKSSPKDVYPRLVARFREVESLYKVGLGAP